MAASQTAPPHRPAEPADAASAFLFLDVPPDVAHTFVVVSEQPGKELNVFSPVAMLGFFEELAEAETNGTATPDRLGEISERNHMGNLGPVPETYL